MNAIDIGVIEAMEKHGGAFEKAFAVGFRQGERHREFMKEKFIETWMKYLAISLEAETEDEE